MNIVLLDAQTMGKDIDLSVFKKFGDLTIYDTTKDSEKIQKSKDADIVITNKVVFDKETLKLLPNLKLICLLATGMNNIDLQAAKELGIVVKNVAGYSTNSVAQHTFSLVLALAGRLFFYDDYVKKGEWVKSEIFTNLDFSFGEIKGKRWGIIGLGTIGKEVAKIATAFGCNVFYSSTSNAKRAEDYPLLSLDELLLTCEIITIHAPLNEKTKNLLSEEKLMLMKQDAILVNVGRGGIVNENAVKNMIENEKIYFGSDVLEFEPMRENSPLRELTCKNRYIITPHVAWGSIEARNRLIKLVNNNIDSFLKEGIK